MRPTIYSTIAATLIGGILFAATQASADRIRRCDGGYRWETTGGTLNGTFGRITASGKKSTAQNARKAARRALMDCVQQHYDDRWSGAVPSRRMPERRAHRALRAEHHLRPAKRRPEP